MPNLATKAWFLASPTDWTAVCKKIAEVIGNVVRHVTEGFTVTRVVTETTQATRITDENVGNLDVGEDC